MVWSVLENGEPLKGLVWVKEVLYYGQSPLVRVTEYLKAGTTSDELWENTAASV